MRHAVRVRSGLAQAGHLILFVRLEVAFEPVPVVGRLLSPLPREDVGGDAVEEPTVVGDDDGAAGECQEGIFQRAESLDVKVVGRLIQQEQIATLLEGESQVQTVALTAGQNAGRLLLVRTLEAKGRDIGTRGHFDIADLDEVQAVRDDLPQRLVRVNTGARLVDIADLDGLADRQLTSLEEWDVEQLDFFKKFDSWFAKADLNEMRDYLLAGTISGAASYLSDDFEQARFDFFGKTLSGTTEMHPRWKRSVGMVSSFLGEALGEVYVKQYFPPEAKERMLKLVKNLQTALGERINMLTWMGDSTKMKAQEKLNSFIIKIGYPDKWKDMSGLNIDLSKSYYENVQACKIFWDKEDINKKAGKPVDNTEWFMNPQTVNAYYNPSTNEICFPAGILQYPFFDPEADDAFNYGAIGVVIGHEMTHGFDDQGRHFDKSGNMIDWWTEADSKGFEEKSTMFDTFFSNIKVLPDLNANGRLTLGENLADHGGLQVSYAAYKNATKGQNLPVVDGLTADQRFFLAYAGVWAGNINEKEIRSRTKSDPHSLGRWRVNGALPHIDAWYEAFGIKEGDKLFIPKSQRLDLW